MSARSDEKQPTGAAGAAKGNGDGQAKPWGGRFSGKTDPTVERFSASIHFDKALARHDIRGSRAQARMLGDAGLLPSADAKELLRGLEIVAGEIEAGTFDAPAE